MYYKLIKNNYIKKIFNKLMIFNENEYYKNDIKNFFLKEKNNEIIDNSCYLDINQNAGGTETHDIIKLFSNFYYKWLKKNFFDFDIIICELSDYGIKKYILFIKNIYSYLLFKNENGVHRIIRKNPLSSNNKIYTSYINIFIIPEIKNSPIIIEKKNLIIDYYKSKGAGGQHVNTTNSAVRIKHIPTNIVVISQSERSQLKNKIFALKILKYKLYLKNNFNNNNKTINKNYIKTYYFENNLIIDHYKKKKYDLNKYFKSEIDFLL